MNKWLIKFLQKEGIPGTDNTDRRDVKGDLSVLSVRSPRHFDEKYRKKVGVATDNTDIRSASRDLSVLSAHSPDISEKICDSIFDDFEERLAIAHYDGGQSIVQAHRIAYQDAFIATLNALHYDHVESETVSDWLDRRITMARKWIAAQGLH